MKLYQIFIYKSAGCSCCEDIQDIMVYAKDHYQALDFINDEFSTVKDSNDIRNIEIWEMELPEDGGIINEEKEL